MDVERRLLGTLFENLGEPNWASMFLSGVSAATKSHAAAVLQVDVQSRQQTLPAFFGQGREMAMAFEQTHAVGNPWRPSDESRGPAEGSVVVPDDVLPLAKLRKTQFWSDFLRPMDVSHGGGIIGLRTAERVVSLTLLRSARRGPYDANERAWLGELAPHWVNACRLQARLTQAPPSPSSGTDLLDRLGSAAFFLDARGRCTGWNAAGDVLLRHGTLVRLRGGHLTAAHPGPGGTIIGNGPRAVRDHTGRVAGHAAMHALHSTHGKAHAVVFVDSIESPEPVLLRNALAAQFGLTGREAELAARLADGCNLNDAAMAMGITPGAARTRLKTVYSKTGTNHQGALVALGRSLRAVLGRDS